MVKNNFDGMLKLLSVDKIEFKKINTQYQSALSAHDFDRHENIEKFNILRHHYHLILLLMDSEPLSDEEINSIKWALLNSSEKVRKEILKEVKVRNTDLFNLVNINVAENYKAEWRLLNTMVLNGKGGGKETLESLKKIWQYKYSQFFIPFESEDQVFRSVAGLGWSSLKLFVYMLLSASVLGYLLTSAVLFYFHSPILVNTADLKSDPHSFSYLLGSFFYSTLMDSISTLVNPFIDLMTLMIRFKVTVAPLAAKSDSENPVTSGTRGICPLV